MNTQLSTRRRLGASVWAGSLLALALMNVAHAAPPIQTQQGIEYVTGGIGSDESAEMKSLAREWPLTMEFAVNKAGHADYVADIHVRVLSKEGHPVLDDVVAKGPFLLARLSPGEYRIEATYKGQQLVRTVNVQSSSHARASFVWQDNAG